MFPCPTKSGNLFWAAGFEGLLRGVSVRVGAFSLKQKDLQGKARSAPCKKYKPCTFPV